MTNSNKSALADVLSDISRVYKEVDDDPESTLPSDFAYLFAVDTVTQAYSVLEVDLVYPRVIADDMAGIRIRWVNGEKDVRFVINSESSEQSYIYTQDGNDYKADYNVDCEKLIVALNWLML